MIVHDHLPWLRVWPKVAKRLYGLFLYDFSIAALYVFGGLKFLAMSGLPVTILGSAIGVFLAFRTGSAYDRWWEARTLWGGLVNYSRTLARQAITLISDDDPAARDLRDRLVTLQIAFVRSLRCHLRGQNPYPELGDLLSDDELRALRRYKNVPAAITLQMGRLLRQAFEEGWIDSIRFSTIDETLTQLTNVQGACERIKNTPLPRQYDYFPRLLVTFFCLLLPLGFLAEFGLATPIASTFVSFAFIVLDSIGRDIETPFANTVHDTPMTTLSRAIEIDLRQHLEQSDLPAELQPVGGLMY
ncbi:MAG: bestrophin family ion channel [Pirellulales bacterium]